MHSGPNLLGIIWSNSKERTRTNINSLRLYVREEFSEERRYAIFAYECVIDSPGEEWIRHRQYSNSRNLQDLRLQFCVRQLGTEVVDGTYDKGITLKLVDDSKWFDLNGSRKSIDRSNFCFGWNIILLTTWLVLFVRANKPKCNIPERDCC